MSGWTPGPGPTNGGDTFRGSNGADSVDALDGNDLVLAEDGNNTIFGGGGNDQLYAGSDADVIFGEAGNDTIGPGDGANFGSGGDGDDQLTGGKDSDTLSGDAGSDAIDGAAGRDLLVGGDGDDRVFGGLGDDTLIGGIGSDTLDGALNDDLIFTNLGFIDSVTGAWKSYDDSVRDYVNESGNSRDTAFAGVDDVLDGGNGAQDLLYVPEGFVRDTVGADSVATLTIGGAVQQYDQVFRDSLTGGVIYARNWELFSTYTPSLTPCFAAGTRIATARGEVAVEDLRIGDRIITLDREHTSQPVVWLGRRAVSAARHPDPATIQPILIKAGALADGVPFRDLRVSPDHALFLHGFLVPAALLVNGASIVQESWCSIVTYWHVELPRHAVLLAEGAPAESYLDHDNRAQFDNCLVVAFRADFSVQASGNGYDGMTCHPVLRQGPELSAIVDRLRARSGLTGHGELRRRR